MMPTGSKIQKAAAGLPEIGFVRLPQIVAPAGVIPISRSAWWAGVASGRFPRPVKLSPRVTVWKVQDIRALVEKLGGQA